MDTSEKLKTMPVGKLIVAMSVPAMFSMLIQSLYNIVDSMYVSKISPTAFNAVSLAYPIQLLILAFSIGIGVGTSSLISRKLGEQKKDEANNVAKMGIIIAIVVSLMFFVLSFIVSKPFFKLMTNDSEVINIGSGYMFIVMAFSAFSIIELTSSRILQGIGNMIVPMICQLVGAITNIILDPIFIFNLNLGVNGAAIATIIGQALAMSLSISVFIFRKQVVNINPIGVKFNKTHFNQILNVGLPVTIMNSISSLTTATLNTLLSTSFPTEELGKAAVNVLSVYFKLQSFVFMPIFGMNQGGMPILSYNYGANIKDRFKKALSIMLFTGFTIMIIGFIAFQFATNLLLDIFEPDTNMITIGLKALPIISFSFIPAVFSIIFATSFQAIGHGFKSLFMSLFRQVIILIPSSIILSKISPNDIWYAYATAETLTALIFVPIAIFSIKKAFNIKEIEKKLILNN